MTGGYVGLVPSRRLDDARPEVERVAGVVWAWDDTDRAWRPRPGALARVRCVTRAVVSERPSQLADLDLDTTAVVAAQLPALGGVPGTVSVVSDRPGRLTAAVAAPGRELLVWNESYHPGWTVAIDGRPQPVIRTNFDYLGCVVPAGRHTVDFRYRPRSIQRGAIVSGCGIGLLGLLAAAGSRSRSPRSQ
jgi:hypothetical protein